MHGAAYLVFRNDRGRPICTGWRDRSDILVCEARGFTEERCQFPDVTRITIRSIPGEGESLGWHSKPCVLDTDAMRSGVYSDRYLWKLSRVRNGCAMKTTEANQALLPTSMVVTPAASAPVAPTTAAADL